MVARVLPSGGYRANDSWAARPQPLMFCLLALKHLVWSPGDLNSVLGGFNTSRFLLRQETVRPLLLPGQQ